MKTFYAIQQIYDRVDVIKIRAEDMDCACDKLEYNHSARIIILTAKEAYSLADSITKLRKRK